MPEVLSQEEIDQLLTVINKMGDEEIKVPSKSDKIYILDFHNNCNFTKEHIHDIQLQTELAISKLNLKYNFHIAAVDQLTCENLYNGFLTKSSNKISTYKTKFSVFDNALISVPDVVLCDCDDFVNLLLIQLDYFWNSSHDIKHALSPSVSLDVINIHQFYNKHKTENYAVASIEVVEGKGENEKSIGIMDIIYPYKDLLKLYKTQVYKKSNLGNAKVNVEVKFGTCIKTIDDVRNFEEGTILKLDECSYDPLQIYVGDTLYAEGEAIIVNGTNFGIRVTKVFESEV